MTLAALQANAAARANDRVSSVDPAAYLESEGVTARVDRVVAGAPANDAVSPANDVADVAAPRARVLGKRRERALRRAGRAI